jgi:hypothetical protein
MDARPQKCRQPIALAVASADRNVAKTGNSKPLVQ